MHRIHRPRLAIALLTGALAAQEAPPTSGPGPRLVLTYVADALFEGATVSVAVDPERIVAGVHRASATVESNRLELALPGAEVPADLLVSWTSRVRQTFSLRTPELAAAVVRGTGGEHRLEVRLCARGVVPMSDAPAPQAAVAGRFGGRADGRGRPPGDAVRAARAALDRGLLWIRGQQQADGGWAIGADGDLRTTAGSRSLATAAACMTLMSNGSTVHAGPDRRALLRGLCWLVEQTDAKTGRIASASHVAPLEEQALVTLGLSEAWVVSRFEPLHEAVVVASHALTAMFDDASASDRRDVAALAFSLLAITSTRDGGQRDDTLAHVVNLLRKQTRDAGALGECAALLAGSFAGDPELASVEDRAGRLLKNVPEPGATQQAAYVYLGTMAMYNAGDPHWTTWRDAMSTQLATGQLGDGALAGSWAPADPAAQMRGRTWTTAMRVLSLQIVHRTARVIERK